jgi:sulfur carrier protein ThiS
MIITLKLSESLLSIYHAAGQHMAETIVMELTEPMTIAQILEQVGINPLLTPMVLVDEEMCKPTQLIEQNSAITLIGPLAGG